MDGGWLSNAYVLAGGPGEEAAFVDSGAPLAPLFDAVERNGLRPRYLLTTHAHADHVQGHDEILARYDVEVVAHPEAGVAGATPLGHGEHVSVGGLDVEALYTPGHAPGHLALLAGGTVCFSADILFAGSVGGSRDHYDQVRSSVMDVLMALLPETRVLPGHTDETTIGEEWESNPFIRIWRGLDPEGTGTCRVDGEEATLVLLTGDYDRVKGGTKAWVRFRDGRDAIVGGSRVER